MTLKEWKMLYYKLKYQNWTDIIIWAEHNDYDVFMDWIINNTDYINFITTKIDYLINILNNLENIFDIRDTLIQLFNLLYNHKFWFNNNPNYKKALLKNLEIYIAFPEIEPIVKNYLITLFDVSL